MIIPLHPNHLLVGTRILVKYDLRGTFDNINAEISREINNFESDYSSMSQKRIPAEI